MQITIQKKAPRSFRKFGKLPGKPSALLTIAVKDLEAAEKAGFKVDMGRWVAVRNDKKKTCTVCLAGAVMACRLKGYEQVKNVLEGKDPSTGDTLQNREAGPFESEKPEVLAEVEARDLYGEDHALSALNALREGELREAFELLDIEFPYNFEEKVNVIDYHRNRLKFKQQMKELAKALAKEGY